MSVRILTVVSLAEEDHLRTYNWWRNCRLLGCFYPPFLSSFLSFYPPFVLYITIIPSYKTILACKSSTYCLTRSSFFLPNEQPLLYIILCRRAEQLWSLLPRHVRRMIHPDIHRLKALPNIYNNPSSHHVSPNTQTYT